MKYRVLIDQDEDGVFVAECPAVSLKAKHGLRPWRTLMTLSLDTSKACANTTSPSRPRSKRRSWR